MRFTVHQKSKIDNLLAEDAKVIGSAYRKESYDTKHSLLKEDVQEMREYVRSLSNEESHAIADKIVERVSDSIKRVVLEGLASKGVYVSELEFDDMMQNSGKAAMVESLTRSGTAQILAKLADKVTKVVLETLKEEERIG